MEAGDAPLEKTFENYEKGIGMLRYCSEKIDRVENKSGIFVSSAGSESEGKKEGWNDRAGFSE